MPMKVAIGTTSSLASETWFSSLSRKAGGGHDWWRATLLTLVVLASALIGGNLLFIFWTSVLEGSVGGLGSVYSLAGYREVFTNPFVLRVFMNTIGFAAVTL